MEEALLKVSYETQVLVSSPCMPPQFPCRPEAQQENEPMEEAERAEHQS